METQFYKVYKSIYDHLTQKRAHCYCPIEAWVDILANVRNSPGERTARVGRYTATWNQGEWPVSQRYLAARWDWSTCRVRKFLKQLSSDGLITLRRSGQLTVIRLCDSELPSVTVEEPPTAIPHAAIKDCPRETAIPTPPVEDKNPATEGDVADEVERVRQSSEWMEMMSMRFNLTGPQIDERLREFVLDCRCRGMLHHKDHRDVQCHIYNWLMVKQRISQNNQQSPNTTNHESRNHRPTSADLIDEAQRRAIEETQDFIKRARMRRAGLQTDISPHL